MTFHAGLPSVAPPTVEFTSPAALASRLCVAVRPLHAASRSTDQSVLHTLYFHPDTLSTHLYLAQNPATPASILDQLASSANVTTRTCVASNLSTPASTLAALASAVDAVVVEAAAKNPRTPLSTLSRLYNMASAVPDIHSFLAQNPASPAVWLKTYAQDDRSVLRQCVAANPSTPASALQALAHDTLLSCQNAAASNPSLPPEYLLALCAQPDAAWALSRNPATPVAGLALLASTADNFVRAHIAGLSRTPSEILSVLARDVYAMVSRAALTNPATPFDLLHHAALYGERASATAVAKNPSLSPELLAHVVSRVASYDVRIATAENPSTSLDILHELTTLPLLALTASPRLSDMLDWTPSTVADTMVALAPEWVGSLAELLACAEAAVYQPSL